jgi:signal transduction histidine kinase
VRRSPPSSADAAVRRPILLLLVSAGVALGLAPAVAGASPPRGWPLDLLVGGTFLAGGLVGQVRRPASSTGLLLAATGLAWFLGNLVWMGTGALSWIAAEALWLHRGVLLHAIMSFASGRLRSPAERFVVALGYLTSLATVARIGVLPLGVWVLAVVVVTRRPRTASADHRWEATTALRTLLAVTLLLAGASLIRAAVGPIVDHTILVAYQLVLATIAGSLTWALVRDRSVQVADLVVELAEGATGDLQDALAGALGDPGLVVAYRRPGTDTYVTADGSSIELTTVDPGRIVTPIEEDGQTLAIVVHDARSVDDARLVASLAAVVRLTSSNVRLSAELRDQIAEVEASRRRLLEAGDDERRRLQQRLDAGARAHLLTALDRLRRAHRISPEVDQAQQQAERTLDDLDELARGLHPVALRAGLDGALRELVGDATVPTTLHLKLGQLPDRVAVTAYFVCAEALTNATKHAHASAIHLELTTDTGRLTVSVADDGVGGATLDGGTGLRGLADRVEGLGGTMTVEPFPGGDKRLVVEPPLDDQPG